MGMNHFREIAYLASIGKPDVAVIINIGTMHIEHLGSIEGILKAKLEILEGMHEDGRIILNGDDGLLWNQKKSGGRNAIYFGVRNPECDLKGLEVREADGMLYFLAKRERHQFAIELALEGQHYVHDALAAIAVGMELDVPVDEIQSSLARFQNMAGRQEIYEKNGYTIIRDCYNAGPESMAAALEVLGAKAGRHIAVLGDMLELGETTEQLHTQVGAMAAQKLDVLITVGELGAHIAKGAQNQGCEVYAYTGEQAKEQAAAQLCSMLCKGDALLLKASRGIRLEQVYEAVKDHLTK
jgi:UDP-N-acetylmuramoyl-tripeptide--D-alanyl-D-alanine ligase